MNHPNWKCPKCGHLELEEGEIHVAGGVLDSLADTESRKFLTVTCKQCTYTELYQAKSNPLVGIFDMFVGDTFKV